MFARPLRIIILSICLIFACVVLGIAAYLVSISNNAFRWPSNVFASLAVATSTITIASLPFVILLMFKVTDMSSMLFELFWLFILWVLWLSTAANTARFNRDWLGGSCGFFNSFANKTCREIKTVEAFAFTIWIILLIYWIILAIFIVYHTTRGDRRKKDAPAVAASGQPSNQQGAPAEAPMQQYQDAQAPQPGAPMNV